MPIVNVADLEGAALDWAVAVALGWTCYPSDSIEQGEVWHLDSERAPFGRVMRRESWKPSTHWNQGGPLIEEYQISVVENLPCSPGRNWETRCSRTAKGAGWRDYGYGPTPLIAAMRCLVAGKLGGTIDVPEELTC